MRSHANAVAKLMGSYPVIVPPSPGLLCAIGDLVADFRDEFAQTYIRLIAKASGGEVADILDDLGARAQEWLEGEGIDESARRISYVTDMRYRDEMRKCRTEVFTGKPLPPHTLLQVVALARPGMMFEVDVVAAVPAGK